MGSFCIECNNNLTRGVYEFSVEKFGIPLCMPHQDWLQDMEPRSTYETISLYFALKERNVPALLEKFDGHKTIDIAVPHAKVNIEVDGGHHIYDDRQALADLKRTFYSFQKGYLTLRIPNSLVKHRLQETADYITDFLIESREKNNAKSYSYRKKY
jgi:hypothetical protein